MTRFGRKIQIFLFAAAVALLLFAGYLSDAHRTDIALAAGTLAFAMLAVLFGVVRAELEVRRRNDLFLDSIFENMPRAVWVKNGETLGLERINRAGEALFGKREEIVGKTCFDMFPPDQARAIDEQDRSILRGTQMVEVIEELQVAAGARWLSVKKIPLLDERGEPAFLLGIAEDITEQRRASEDARRVTRDQLRALTARIESGREEEKTLMAREIHDVLGQELTGLKLDAGWLLRRIEPMHNAELEPLANRVLAMIRQIDNTIATVRRLATDLRPAALDELGLISALIQHARDFEKRAHLEVAFDASLDEAEPEVPRPVAIAIFRIFQELLTNVARHAEAKHVFASLRVDGEHLVLVVKDDGIGISRARASSADSLGLLGVRERAFLFGGEVDIFGAQSEGTTVSVRIPYAAKSPRDAQVMR